MLELGKMLHVYTIDVVLVKNKFFETKLKDILSILDFVSTILSLLIKNYNNSQRFHF